MNEIQPITPQEAQKRALVPKGIIKAINELITLNFFNNCATVTRPELEKLLSKSEMAYSPFTNTRTQGAVIGIYYDFGWHVTYRSYGQHRPDDSGPPATLTFTPRK